MARIGEILRRMVMLVRGSRFDRDLADEMQLHMDLRAERQRREGAAPERARLTARRLFGSPLRLREESRDVWRWSALDRVMRDVRYGLRGLRRNPSFTAAAVLTLALGIGATTTIFGLLNAVLLRPLPYPESDRLVELWGTVQRERVERRGTSFPDYFDWRDRARSFDGMAAWDSNGFIAYGEGEPIRVNGEAVDGPYFELLGVRPLFGRVLQADDHRLAAARVAVIGERLWEQRFNRRPDVIGRSLQLNSLVFTVVGVVPASFSGRSDEAVVWVPVRTAIPPNGLAARGNRGFAPIARLAPGVNISAAQEEMAAICAQLEREYPATNERRSVEVVSLAGEIFDSARPAVSLLFGAVFLVLLLACANVASLLLARTEARRQEMLLRRALGAAQGQLAGLVMAESALLVIAGCAAGWAIAHWAGPALVSLGAIQLPSFAAPDTDWRTVLFVSAVAVATTIGIGLAAMPLRSGPALTDALRERQHAWGGGGRSSTLRLVVVAEVTVAVTLLVGAALLGRSFAALLRFDPGFDAGGVLAMRVQRPPRSGAAPGAASPGAMASVRTLAILDQLRALPGVDEASMSTSVPLSGTSAIFFSAEGMPPTNATNRPRAYLHRITPGHFATLGVRMLAGRDFTTADLEPDSTAVIVSQNVARRFWPGEDAIGRRIKQGDLNLQTPWLTIVGVVQEANLRGIPRNPTNDPDVYFPFSERVQAFAVLLRGSGNPGALAEPARAVLQSAEPGLAVYQVQPLTTLVDRQLAPARFLAWLTGVFAALSLTLVGVGVYGTLSYWVRHRTGEIAIRAALGASRGNLLALVLGQAVVFTTGGVLLGGLLALGLVRFIETQLFGVQPLDWMSLGGAAAVMLIATVLAALAPALRALRLDPVAALRLGT